MKISRSKFVSVFALSLSLIFITSVFALPNVIAHSPPQRISTWTRVAVAPDPVGLGQSVSIVFWNTVPFPGWVNSSQGWVFDVNVTSPSNVTSSLGRFVSDSTGRVTTSFLPTAVGAWVVSVSFPETFFGWSDNAAQRVFTNDTFLASSANASFVVQANQVPSALPTEYTSSTGQWFRATSNYYGSESAQVYGSHSSVYRGNVTGSLTSHVLWTKPLENGGLVGGTNVGVPGDTYYSGLAYAARWNGYYSSGSGTVVLDGKLYYKEPLGMTERTGGYIILDLSTGKEIARTSITTTVGFAYSCNGFKALVTTSGTTWTLLNPDTISAFSSATTVTNVPAGNAGSLGPSDEVLRFVVSSSGAQISQWNSSRVIGYGISGATAGGGANAYDYQNVGITYNGANFTIPSGQRNVYAYAVDDIALLTNLATGTTGVNLPTTNFTTWLISLKPATRGQVIANYTFDCTKSPINDFLGSPGLNLAVYEDLVETQSRVLPAWCRETQQWVFINFEKGNITGPTEPESPWNYYASPTVSGGTNRLSHRDAQALNGKIVSGGYSGIVYVYDGKTGKLEFTYGCAGKTVNANVSSSGFQTVYGVYPSFIAAATTTNGKIYLVVNEHSPNTPLLKGAYLRCIDILTQKEDWILAQYGGGTHSGNPYGLLVANGITVNLNHQDQQLYGIGRGPSATTVNVASQTWTQGNKMVIEGTVLDVAAGTNQSEQAARFPTGVACVSDDNMSQWMEYVYMHRSRPTDIVGVNVALSAIGPDGNVYDIGNVTSDDTGYFNSAWTPQIAGTYTVIANFAGSGAYYPSYGKTAVVVDSTPIPVVTPSPTPAPTTESDIIESTAAIIAAIALFTLVMALILRKR